MKWLMLLAGLVTLFGGMASASDDRSANPFVQCLAEQEIKDEDACIESVGRIEWYPYRSPVDCIVVKEILKAADQRSWDLSWKLLFMNERCRRLEQPFYKRNSH